MTVPVVIILLPWGEPTVLNELMRRLYYYCYRLRTAHSKQCVHSYPGIFIIVSPGRARPVIIFIVGRMWFTAFVIFIVRCLPYILDRAGSVPKN